MPETSVLDRVEQRNGTARRPVGKRTTGKPRAARRKPLPHARRLACAVGAVRVGVLGLSVTHCTESIGLLTGSHWALSGLLAVGIDAGMVASELAELASHGTKAGEHVRPWACGNTMGAVLLSVLLNAYAYGLHAAPGQAGRASRASPRNPSRGAVRWVRPPAPDWSVPGLLVISTATVGNTYAVSAVRSGDGPHFGGRIVGIALEKQGAAEVYHVDVTPVWGWSCDCWDALIRDRYAVDPAARCCKHSVLLHEALAAVGVLPEMPATEAADPFARIA
jgi:hypothetical protein